MENKYFGVIYKVTNNINGKVYIGQTIQNFYKRKWSHESRAKNFSDNMPFHKAINKYGKDNFTWEIIEYCDSVEELNEMEFHYIKQYESETVSGYNCTCGGEGTYGFKHKPETIERLRCLKIGTKLSEESISKRTEKQSYRWRIIFPDGKEQEILNLNAFCRKHNLNASSLGKVAAGIRAHHRGYRCVKLSNRVKIISRDTRNAISKANIGRKLTEDQIKKRILSQRHFWEIITLKDGSKIIVKNLKEFCRNNNLHYSSMLRVSRGDRNHHKGYKCRKLNVENRNAN